MMLILKAILVHATQLVTLRHAGEGLPLKRGGTLACMLALAALSRVATLMLTPDAVDLPTQAMFFVIYFGLVWKILRPIPMAAVLLVELAENLVLASLYAASVIPADQTSLARGVLFTWGLVSLFVFLNRLVKKTAEAPKN